MAGWETEKRRSLERIARDKEIGYLDLRALGLIEAINRVDSLYTTSSCSGRIAIVDSKWPWEKEEIHTVFKSHEKVSTRDITGIITLPPQEAYWLMVRGPILHVVSRDLESAGKLLRMARESGFKHSGIMDITSSGYLVELISSAQVTMPLRDRSAYYVSPDSLNTLIMLSNDVLENGWIRLERLRERVEGW